MELPVLLKILLAAVLGGLIGLEREMAHKEAGLRTNILIAIGSTLFTILSLKIAAMKTTADPARIAAQILPGIGFLGAGSIIQARFSVHGLTTAASIWTVSAIGMAVGVGYYLLALAVTLFVLMVLIILKYSHRMLEAQHKNFLYLVSTEDRVAVIMDIKKVLTELNIKGISSKLIRVGSGYEYEVVFHSSENKSRQFLDKTMQLPGVHKVFWETV